MRDASPMHHRDSTQEPAGRRNGSAGAHRLTGSNAVEHAKAHLLEMTGQSAESVSSLSRTCDGWRITLEIVELERIPRTTDILASYVVELDDQGELLSYSRVHRYFRNEVNQ
ncbi:MAG TPA: gas vesicle protein [Humisphaera sp.]|jgi:hypothetical protein|nr:gas vesicle protein [Humisphaera sp.]